MRLSLDHFFPYRPRSHERPGRRRLRTLLRRAGPTWASSPVRRVVQTAFFGLFLVLFFWVAWPYGSPDYAGTLRAKEIIDAEVFLALDPLVSVSTAIASRTWVWSLGFAALMVLSGLLVPRGFCGYVCPLGTLIDLFDAAVGKRVKTFRVEEDGPWVHLKYYLLAGVLAASVGGVLLSGFVAAIPVITRGMLFTLGPIQSGLLRGWYLVPPMDAGHLVSVVLFAMVLGLGLLRPRFWCRYVCPTGAVFSLFNRFRAAERKVDSTCVSCNRCIQICPFDAIKADFTTRTADCTMCQTCGGVCPTHAIRFVGRWDRVDPKPVGVPPLREIPLSRRGFLLGVAGGSASAAITGTVLGAGLSDPTRPPPVRPPGSVPEPDFLRMCIRCGECFKACPNDVLQPLGFRQGLEGLWTPAMDASWSGCDPGCSNCGQVCPTGAIRALPLEEKRAARMGLAIVDPATCLPHAGKEGCRLCADECAAAGYAAIEFVRVHAEVDDTGAPVPGSGFLAPCVLADRCVGCGLCQMRCHGINVAERKVLRSTAIAVEAGEGKEDRIRHGSYLALRTERDRLRAEAEDSRRAHDGSGDEYLPEFLRDDE